MNDKSAKFGIGAIVRHRVYPFRGVVVDVDLLIFLEGNELFSET